MSLAEAWREPEMDTAREAVRGGGHQCQRDAHLDAKRIGHSQASPHRGLKRRVWSPAPAAVHADTLFIRTGASPEWTPHWIDFGHMAKFRRLSLECRAR